MDIKTKLWERIRQLRKLKNISQEELASRAKLHRTYLSAVERGQKNISVENIEKVAIALECEVRELF